MKFLLPRDPYKSLLYKILEGRKAGQVPVIRPTAASSANKPSSDTNTGVAPEGMVLSFGEDGGTARTGNITISEGANVTINESGSGTDWDFEIASATQGDVTGPGSSVDNEPAIFDGTTGKVIQGGTGWTWDPATGILTGSALYANQRITINPVGGFILFNEDDPEDAIVAGRKNADAGFRFTMSASGTMTFGSGAGAGDLSLFRLAANVLGLAADDAFCIQGGATTPATGTDGTLYYNTTDDEMVLRANGTWEVLNDREAAHGYTAKTSDTTVANTTTKTSVYSWTVPADQWEVGTQCQLSLHMAGTAVTTPDLTLTIEDGTNTLVTHTFTALGMGQHSMHIQSMLTCRTDGATGGIHGISAATGSNSAGAAIFNRSAANTDTTDTTASTTYTVYLQWSAANANNTMTVSAAGVLRIN